MPEAIAKYALNSTIGTPDFKPLDQIIEGQKSLVASDNIYATLLGRISSGGALSKDVVLKANCSGSVRLRVSGYKSSNNMSISVLRNGTVSATFTISKSADVATDRETIAFLFEKNDAINIRLSNSSPASFDNLYLLADLIDGSALTIL